MKLSRITSLIFAGLLQCGFIGAQTKTSKVIVPSNRILIDTLIDHHGSVSISAGSSIQNIEKSNRGKNDLSGYRVQIYFGGDLNQAKKIRQDFIAAGYPHGAYLAQNIPDFSIRIGDFLTENDAKTVMKSMVNAYPGAFVVKDFIQLPKLDNYYREALDE
jgi:SPOR domain